MKNFRIVIIVAAVILLAGCGANTGSQDTFSNVESLVAAEKDTEELPYEETVAFITPEYIPQIAEYKAKYPDTAGWLNVPGTTIDSVVVQGDDVTNEYYLAHDIGGNPDTNGTYSVHWLCSVVPGKRGDISQNTVLFAHNLDEDPNGILFAQLKKYKVIYIESKSDVFSFRHHMYLAATDLLGKEVMINEQMDGYYYKDAAKFKALLELFE